MFYNYAPFYPHLHFLDVYSGMKNSIYKHGAEIKYQWVINNTESNFHDDLSIFDHEFHFELIRDHKSVGVGEYENIQRHRTMEESLVVFKA